MYIVHMYLHVHDIGVGSMEAVGALAPKLLKAWGHCPHRIMIIIENNLTLQDNESCSVVIAPCGCSTRRAYGEDFHLVPHIHVPPYSISTSYAYACTCIYIYTHAFEL